MEERNKHFERPTTYRPPSLFNLTLLAALFGLVAGFFGYILANKSNVVANPNTNSPVNFELNIEQPLVNIARKYQQSIAGVYKARQNLQTTSPITYQASDFLGTAVVVTSDGWLMSTDQVISNTTHDIILDDQVYQIEEIKTDNFSGVVFIKIKADNLQPTDFQLTDDLAVGERLFTNIDLPNSAGHFYQTADLAHDHYVVNRYLSTDEADYYLKISETDTDQNLLAAPFFNTAGDIFGLWYQVDGEAVLLPAEYLRQAVKHLLDDTERILLGVRYIDLENNSGFEQSGDLVYHPNLAAVKANSLAAKAGLKLNDQIIAVNNDVISAERSLTSILQDYRAGDTIIIKILRNETEQDLEVEL